MCIRDKTESKNIATAVVTPVLYTSIYISVQFKCFDRRRRFLYFFRFSVICLEDCFSSGVVHASGGVLVLLSHPIRGRVDCGFWSGEQLEASKFIKMTFDIVMDENIAV